MTASVIRFPDVICVATPIGQRVRATTEHGRNVLSNVLGLPCKRATEVENLVLDIAIRHGDCVAYDLPMREGR